MGIWQKRLSCVAGQYGGTPKPVNPTQVHEHMGHPVFVLCPTCCPAAPPSAVARVLLRVVADGVGGRGEDDAGADVAEHGAAGHPGPLGQAGRQVLNLLAEVTLVSLQELVRTVN